MLSHGAITQAGSTTSINAASATAVPGPVALPGTTVSVLRLSLAMLQTPGGPTQASNSNLLRVAAAFPWRGHCQWQLEAADL